MGFGLLVIRNIPCYKCEECDEIFYTGDVARKVEAIVAEAKQLMQEIRAMRISASTSTAYVKRDIPGKVADILAVVKQWAHWPL